MEPLSIEPGLIAVAGVATAGAAGAWLRLRRRPALPANAVPVVQAQVAPRMAGDAGALMLVGCGTFGAMEVLRLLNVLAASGLDRLIGSVLLIENDADVLATVRARTPRVYDDRLVLAASGSFAKGMGGQAIADVMGQRELWQRPIEDAAERAADRHQRLNSVAAAPGLILTFVSGGGHAPLGVPAVATLHAHFPQVVVLGVYVLPSYTRLRERFATVKGLYEAAGVRGWLMADNLIGDQTTADHCRAALLAGLAETTLRTDQPVALNNALLNALPEERGGILLTQSVATSLPAYPAPAGRQAFYTLMQPVADTMLRVRRTLADGGGRWSVEVPAEPARSITLDLLVTNLPVAALQSVADQVRASLLTALPERRLPADYDLQFASLALPVDPERLVCHVLGIRLVRLAAGVTLDELVALPSDRPLQAAVPAANGHRAGARLVGASDQAGNGPTS